MPQVWESARYWRLLIADHHGGPRVGLTQVHTRPNALARTRPRSPLSVLTPMEQVLFHSQDEAVTRKIGTKQMSVHRFSMCVRCLGESCVYLLLGDLRVICV